MLALAKVAPNDVVYDLGSGDGRILIAAAELHHARGVGIEIDPQLIKEANQNVGRERLQDRISLRNEDLFQADIHEANVVTLFLWPQVNLKLRPKLLRELRPGTRVVSYCWNMGDWVPEKTIRVGGDPIYLWTIPNDGTTR